MDKVKEQTICDCVGELGELLRILNVTVDYLVERRPSQEEPDKSVKQTPVNVFDEILDNLSVCKGLIREATGKIQIGISQKVQ